MHENKGQYDEIKRYLRGEMTALEKREFEDRMSNDDVLSKNVKLQLFGRQLIVGQKLINIREKMTAEYDDYRPMPMWKKVLPVLLILAIIAAGVAYTQLYQDQNTTRKESPTIVQDSIDTTSEQKITNNDTATAKKDTTTTSKQKPSTAAAPHEKEEEEKLPCESVTIDFKVAVDHTCQDTATGAIRILPYTISGGSKPYKGTVNDSSGLAANNLSEGLYEVKVTDDNGCTRLKRIIIKNINCGTDATDKSDQDTTAAPDQTKNIKWSVPLKEGKKGMLIITDKDKKTVYKDSVSSTFEWNVPDEGAPHTYKLTIPGDSTLSGTIQN